METRQWWCLEKGPAGSIPAPYFRVQVQGYSIHGIRIDKYDVVEFRGRVQ